MKVFERNGLLLHAFRLWQAQGFEGNAVSHKASVKKLVAEGGFEECGFFSLMRYHITQREVGQ